MNSGTLDEYGEAIMFKPWRRKEELLNGLPRKKDADRFSYNYSHLVSSLDEDYVKLGVLLTFLQACWSASRF